MRKPREQYSNFFGTPNNKMRNRPVWECDSCTGLFESAEVKKGKCPRCDVKMICHASQKEFKRWKELQTLEKAGQIRGLRRQVKFTFEIPYLDVDGAYTYETIKTPKGRDLAAWWDFVYEERGTVTGLGWSWQRVVEDAKGRKAGAAYDLFWLKRELMRLVHGIEVREI